MTMPSTMVYFDPRSARYSIWSRCQADGRMYSWGDPRDIEGAPADEQLRQMIVDDIDRFPQRQSVPPSPEFLGRGGAFDFQRDRLAVAVTRTADSYTFTPFFRQPSGAGVSEPLLARSVGLADAPEVFAGALRECFASMRSKQGARSIRA